MNKCYIFNGQILKINDENVFSVQSHNKLFKLDIVLRGTVETCPKLMLQPVQCQAVKIVKTLNLKLCCNVETFLKPLDYTANVLQCTNFIT
jgi:hypothetical protein